MQILPLPGCEGLWDSSHHIKYTGAEWDLFCAIYGFENCLLWVIPKPCRGPFSVEQIILM